jgi:hypothetical protein
LGIVVMGYIPQDMGQSLFFGLGGKHDADFVPQAMCLVDKDGGWLDAVM